MRTEHELRVVGTSVSQAGRGVPAGCTLPDDARQTSPRRRDDPRRTPRGIRAGRRPAHVRPARQRLGGLDVPGGGVVRRWVVRQAAPPTRDPPGSACRSTSATRASPRSWPPCRHATAIRGSTIGPLVPPRLPAGRRAERDAGRHGRRRLAAPRRVRRPAARDDPAARPRGLLPREDFRPKATAMAAQVARRIEAIADTEPALDDTSRRLVETWTRHAAVIDRLVRRSEELGARIRDREAQGTRSTTSGLPRRPPREQRAGAGRRRHRGHRLGRGDAGAARARPDVRPGRGHRRGRDRRQATAFEAGYGTGEADPLLIAWYRIDWAVQDLADFARRVLLDADVGRRNPPLRARAVRVRTSNPAARSRPRSRPTTRWPDGLGSAGATARRRRRGTSIADTYLDNAIVKVLACGMTRYEA